MKDVKDLQPVTKKGTILRLERKFKAGVCPASVLLKNEMQNRGVADDPELLAAVQHLQEIEDSFQVTIHVKANNEFIPMLAGMNQQNQKLLERQEQERNKILYGTHPVRQLLLDELKQKQAAEKQKLLSEQNERIKAFNADVEKIKAEHREKIFTFFQQYIRQLYK